MTNVERSVDAAVDHRQDVVSSQDLHLLTRMSGSFVTVCNNDKMLQTDLARSYENPIVLLTVEILMAPNCSIVLADGRVQFDTTSQSALLFVVTEKAKHTFSRIPVHDDSGANVVGGWPWSKLSVNRKDSGS